MIEKEFGYNVDEFSAQLFEINKIPKKKLYGGIPLVESAESMIKENTKKKMHKFLFWLLS